MTPGPPGKRTGKGWAHISITPGSPCGPQQVMAATEPMASYGWTLPSSPPTPTPPPGPSLPLRDAWSNRNTDGATPHSHTRSPAVGATAEAQPGPGSRMGAARAEVLSPPTHQDSCGCWKTAARAGGVHSGWGRGMPSLRVARGGPLPLGGGSVHADPIQHLVLTHTSPL